MSVFSAFRPMVVNSVLCGTVKPLSCWELGGKTQEWELENATLNFVSEFCPDLSKFSEYSWLTRERQREREGKWLIRKASLKHLFHHGKSNTSYLCTITSRNLTKIIPKSGQIQRPYKDWSLIRYIDIVGTSTDMSRLGMIGQVYKVTRVESPGCLATGKTETVRALPPGWPFLL